MEGCVHPVGSYAWPLCTRSCSTARNVAGLRSSGPYRTARIAFPALEERRLPLSRSGGEIASSCRNPIPFGGPGPLPDRGADGAASASARQPLDHAPCFFVHHDVDTSSHAVPRCSIGCVAVTHFREHGKSTAPPPRTRGHRLRDARTPVPVVGIQHSPIHAGGTVQNQGLSPGQG